MSKINKSLWEKFSIYPSFRMRFWLLVAILLVIFFSGVYFSLYQLNFVDNPSDTLSLLNLYVQGATFLLAIVATYYALRQLVETRFNSLDSSAMEELKRKHYTRAINKWKEAFYIRPDVNVFANLCESFLLVGDYDIFDRFLKLIDRKPFFKKKIIQEDSDKLIFLFLKSVRHLLVKNQGAAETSIKEIVSLVTKDETRGPLRWDFLDLQTAESYLNLSGECKDIAENLITYLSQEMSATRKIEFEAGKFSTKIP